MNQVQYNGHFGCYACSHMGVQLVGSGKYPNLPYENLPMAQDRTHQSIRAAMMMNRFHEGQKGASEMLLLRHFDTARGNGMDDLHPFYEGVAKFYCGLLIGHLGGHAPDALRTMNLRMQGVRTPIQMARK